MLLLKEQLGDVLKTLTPREEKVLSLRFGLEDGHPRTLEEVGKEFNVTRERIRQIERRRCENCAIRAAAKNSRIFWIDCKTLSDQSGRAFLWFMYTQMSLISGSKH